MGGAGIDYWEPIAELYGLDLQVTQPYVDPTFSFMTVDKDGKIRMDCSSPYAMAGLIGLKDQFDIAFGNDPDFDRHGIVDPQRRPDEPQPLPGRGHQLPLPAPAGLARGRGRGQDAGLQFDDRPRGGAAGAPLAEVPVGFKWFVDGLLDGSYGFGGEESAGASFLRRDGTVWTTDKDGIIMDLLAAEITAVTGRDPGEHYQRPGDSAFGSPVYERSDAPASRAQKEVSERPLAGDGRPPGNWPVSRSWPS